jgi:hypothetical protein
MKMLRITDCSRAHSWYADMIGQLVPCLGVWPGDAYKSLEPAGYINRVEFSDAVVVEVDSAGDAAQPARQKSSQEPAEARQTAEAMSDAPQTAPRPL